MGVRMKNVLDEIDRLRLKRGWTEYELAKNSGVPQSTISTWYRRRQVPTIENLNKICQGLNVTLSAFFAEGEDAVTLTQEQREMLDNWSALSPKQREAVLELLKSMVDE